MHALFLVVSFDDEEQAVQSLHRDIIPEVQQAPGFSSGTWFGNKKSGHGLVLFETENQARAAAVPVNTTLPGGTVVLSCDIYRVQGRA